MDQLLKIVMLFGLGLAVGTQSNAEVVSRSIVYSTTLNTGLFEMVDKDKKVFSFQKCKANVVTTPDNKKLFSLLIARV
jgi:hypothetical protein